MGRYDDEDIDEVDEMEAAPARSVKTAPVDDIEDDEDEAPKPAARQIKRGWGAAEKVKNVNSAYAQRLKVTEDTIIVKFLEDEPYASFRQHWVERPGQKSFTCIADLSPKGCPLCDGGNRPATRFAFNVVQLEQGGEPSNKSYEVGPRVIDQLKNFHTDPRQGPLTKHYWAISRTGKGTTSNTNHQLVKERDLEEEWAMQPISDAEMRSLKSSAYGPEIVEIPDRKTLQDIVIEDLDD